MARQFIYDGRTSLIRIRDCPLKTFSINSPITFPSGPSALVIRVWQVAHISDCRTCSASVGRNPLDDVRMILVCPASILKGPYSARSPSDPGGSILNPPTRLARVPSPSLLI